MATQIGLRIGVDGEAEFRKSINGINDSFKTLKSEMGAVTSAFDKNDKSQEKLTEANKVLNKQIDLQKQKLSEVSAMLEKSKDKYGENDAKTQSWKRTVNDATTELNKLERQLKDNNATLGTATTKWGAFTAAADNLKGKLSALGDGLSGVGRAFTVGITAPVGAAVAGLTALGNKAIDNADSLQKMSDVTGLSAEELQELQFVGNNLGVELDTVAGAQAKLTKSMFAAKDGTGTQAEAFDALNVSVVDANGNLKDAQTVMGEAFTALNGVGNETERDALAMQIFGKSAMELNPLIKAGADEIARLKDEAQKMGAVISDEDVAALDAFGDSMDGVKMAISATFAKAFADMLPKLQELMPIILDEIVPAIAGFVEGIANIVIGFGNLPGPIQGVVGGLGGLLVAAGPLLMFFGAIASGISSIVGLFGAGGLIGSLGGATAATAGAAGSAGGLAAAFTALTGPIGIAIAAIAGIGAVIAGAWQNSEVFRNSISTSFETIRATVTGAFNQIGMAMAPALESFKGFSANVNPILKEIGDFLGIYVVPLVTQFIVTFVQGFSAIVTAMAPFIAAIGNLFSFIGNFVGMVFALLTGDWSTAWTFAQGIGQSAVDFIGNIFQGLSNWVNLIFTGISTFLMGIWQGIYDNTIGKVIEMVTTVAAHFEEIRVGAQTKFEEIKQDIITAVQELPGKLYQVAKDMLGEMVKGIQETAGDVYGAVTGLVGDVMKKFKEGFGIASPSKELFNIGKFLIQGLINGLNGDSLMAFVNNMVEEIKAKFAGGNFNLKAAIDFVGSGAAEFFKSIGIGGASFSGLTAPVGGGITSNFGDRDSFMTDSGEMSSSYHGGLDIGAAYGAAVGAAGAGTVSMAGWNGGYGNSVIIDHGNGLETLYAHLSEIMVSVGQLVTQLQTIGLVGSTGNSTGPHLHFGIYQDGVAIDPSSLYGFDVGSRYIPQDMVAMVHQGEMIVPRAENPYVNSGGSILPMDNRVLNDIKRLLVQLVGKNPNLIMDGKVVGGLIDERLGALI